MIKIRGQFFICRMDYSRTMSISEKYMTCKKKYFFLPKKVLLAVSTCDEMLWNVQNKQFLGKLNIGNAPAHLLDPISADKKPYRGPWKSPPVINKGAQARGLTATCCASCVKLHEWVAIDTIAAIHSGTCDIVSVENGQELLQKPLIAKFTGKRWYLLVVVDLFEQL